MATNTESLLLVDDDANAIRALDAILGGFGDKRFATSGQEALRLAGERSPDLVIVDFDMPGMNGFALMEALKADPRLADVPVIMATGISLGEVEAAALERGAADFLAKPLVAAQVRARVLAQLRAGRERRRAPADLPLPRPDDTPPRVLIVDDDATAIHALREALADIADFHFARDADECIAQARRLLPDLILLDIVMPGVDGFQLCRDLKLHRLLCHVPVVFVTRFGDGAHEARALELGAVDFVAHPYRADVLRARVRNLLGLKRRRDAELRRAVERRLELADRRVAEVVAAASDAIVSVDADGIVVLFNAAAGRLLGAAGAGPVGRPLEDCVAGGLDGWARADMSGERRLLQRRDGTTVAVELSAFAVGQRGERLVTLMLRDVTDRERLEDEARARAAAEAASAAKSAFLSYVVHELGNPLNGLLGLLELGGVERGAALPEAWRTRLDAMQECGRQLRGLMRDLLDMGRLDSGALALALQPVDPVRCMAEALAAVRADAAAAGVTVHLEPGAAPTVQADPQRLRQCLVNLIGNALKYGRPGGRVELSVRAGAGAVHIGVRDDGPGLDPMQRAQLFQPFNRLGQERGARPGAGLGLIITRRLVEAMGGRLEVDSVPGAGSCFSLVLPPAAAQEGA